MSRHRICWSNQLPNLSARLDHISVLLLGLWRVIVENFSADYPISCFTSHLSARTLRVSQHIANCYLILLSSSPMFNKVPNSAYDMNSFALLACSKLQRITPCKDCNIVASYIVVVLKRSTLHRVKTATG